MSLAVTADPHLNIYTQIIGGLCKPIASITSKCIVSTSTSVPYYISIGAVNELGYGNITSVAIFTKTESKDNLNLNAILLTYICYSLQQKGPLIVSLLLM